MTIIDCYGRKHNILDGDILRDHTVEWTLIQSLETSSRTMFIVVFSGARDICMINSIHRKHKYHQILQRRALTSRKRRCERWFIKNILTCVI